MDAEQKHYDGDQPSGEYEKAPRPNQLDAPTEPLPSLAILRAELDAASIAWAEQLKMDVTHPLVNVHYLTACMADFSLETAQRYRVVVSAKVKEHRRYAMSWRIICTFVLLGIALIAGSRFFEIEKANATESMRVAIAVIIAAALSLLPLLKDIGVDGDGRKQSEWDKILTSLGTHIHKKHREDRSSERVAS